MEIDSAEYQLRCQLTGHEDDVRGIRVCDNVGFATSSRDRTIRFWSPDESNHRSYTTSKILLGHTSFVGPLAWVAPSEELPEGGLVSGGMDSLILVWNLATGEKIQTLKGHKLQVTCIALDGSDVVSTSVDCTLRRWRKGEEVDVLEAHKAAIQAIIKLPSGELVTGSSDTTLKLWKGAACIHTFSGHTDTVRGLAAVPGLGILSASHDGTIRLWELSGQVLLEMVGHTSIVYSVDAHASGLIVSGSEDRFAKIWKDGVCVQSLEHPGCVWDAKFLDNGDIVTACSDSVVRIWTAHQDKIADPLELESYAAQLSQYKLSRKRVGGLKLEEFPGLEALQTPGTSDGQTKVVREGDSGVAYAWNMMEQKWDKIEVVDGPDDGMSRPLVDGIQYDYVFDVDIGDGEPVLKLPCNRSDNPYDVAEKWLLKENLPLSYREQIVEFILQNTGQKQFTPDPSFRDPYTGSSAYTHGQSSKPAAAKPAFQHVPKKGLLVFDAAQFDGILKKVSEFNNTLQSASKNQRTSKMDNKETSNAIDALTPVASSFDTSISTSQRMDNQEASYAIDALSLIASTSESSISASQMTLAEKFKIVRSIGEECIQEDELMNLLAKKPQPICYDGFEPSGRMHIAQGVLKALNVNKLTSAGCKVKIWIADWFAQLNNKMGGDLKKIEVVGQYLIEIWKAVGMNLEGDQVEFLWSSKEINSRAHEYWPLVMDIGRRNKLPRILRCCQIMGRSEQDELTAAQIFYPCMQCADIFFLKADICQLGMDQRKVNVLAREYCDAIKRKNKPIILSHHMLPGLQEGQEKMSKSDPSSSIYMEDEEADVNVKIKKAFCPPKVVEKNPCLEYIKYIVLPWFNEFKIERSVENGCDKTYNNFEELVADYESGSLHPADLKPALSKAVNKILQPVRDHFKNDQKAKDLMKRVKSYKVTR